MAKSSKSRSRAEQTILRTGDKKVDERISRLSSLVESTKILNSTLDLDKLLNIIMDVATKEMKCDRSTLFLISGDGEELISKVAQGPEITEIRVPKGAGLVGHSAKTGEIINITDAYNDSRFNQEIDRRTGFHTKTILCMPMRNREGVVIGVLQVLNKHDGQFSADDEYFLEVLSSLAAVAIENARLHLEELEKKRIESELNVASEIQKNLLPKAPPEVDGYDIAGLNVPTKHVGGDYFDFLTMKDGHLGIAIGDVSGKGVPASLLMANLQAAIRANIEFKLSPVEILTKSNSLIFRSSTPDKFITFFYCVLDNEKHCLTFSNAGHNYPIIRHQDGSFSTLELPGLILGITDETFYTQESYDIRPHDTILLYTDGVNETADSEGEEFGEDRINEIMDRNPDATAQELLDEILKAVNDFSAGIPQYDDITIVVIKRL
jgi:sigma-B regulation protein RsbU (phosphoserine phosphatase)